VGTFATTTALDTLMPGTGFDTQTNNAGTKAIDWSENWIKGKLSKRYNVAALPFTAYTSTSQLTSYAEQLAMGYLFKIQSRGSKESISRGQALIDEVKQSIMEIADYQCDLLDASTSSIPVGDKSGRVEIIGSASGYHTTFDEDDPLNWKPDSDKLTDIESDRD